MSTLYVLINNKPYKNTSDVMRKGNQNEALAILSDAILKEKCLNLVKISKRNTGYQVYNCGNSSHGVTVYDKCNITI